MLTAEHEALHRIFQRDEKLFTRAMARVFGIELPGVGKTKFTVLSTDLTETEPLERHADSVLLAEFLVEDETGKYILVIESQTDPEAERLRRWPHFISHLHDRHDCPVVVAVVCSKAATARWARKPINIGLPGLLMQQTRVIVFGPDNVPAIIDDIDAAADVMVAVFSALTHSRGPKAGAILEALASALNTIDEKTASSLQEFTEVGLGKTPGAEIWRAIMATRTYPFVSETRRQGREEGRVEGREEGREEGKAEGIRTGIFAVFEQRSVEVDAGSRERIEECTDLATLNAWLKSSVTVAKAGDLFK